MKKLIYFITLLFFLMPNVSALGIKSINFDNYEMYPKFNTNTFHYNIFVGSDIKKINVILKENKDFICNYKNKYKLKKGYNDIKIDCSKDERIEEYHFNVVRGDINKNYNYGLKSLEILNHEIDFSNKKTHYRITLNDEENCLYFNFEKYNDKDKVEIKGNSNFLKGTNIIKIKVKGEKDVIYRIEAVKTKETFKEINNLLEEENDTNEIIYIILLIIGFILSIYFIYYILFKKLS